MAQARLIAQEGRTYIATESSAQYVGSHWMPARAGRYFGQYPPGLPALLAVIFRLWGPYATLWVIPLMGSLSLVALFLVCRTWVGPGWGFLAAVLMAFNPYANQHALGADSHTAVCFFLTWGLYCLVRWERSGSFWWAAAAGVCGGIIPTIRYPEVLFLAAFMLFLVLSPQHKQVHRWRSVLAGLIGAGVPLAALALRNQMAFGAFWKTGYSLTGEQTAFSLGSMLRHGPLYLGELLVVGIALVFPLGIAGTIKLYSRPATKTYALFFMALVLPITLVYMAYYFMPSMRFLLPTFFVYTIAAVWFLRLLSETQPRRAGKWTVIVLVVTAVWGLPQTVFALHRLKRDNAELAQVAHAIERHVEPGSLVIADGGLDQHLDFLGSWRLASADGLWRRDRPGPPFLGPAADEDEMRPSSDEPRPDNREMVFRRDIARWAGDRHKILSDRLGGAGPVPPAQADGRR